MVSFLTFWLPIIINVAVIIILICKKVYDKFFDKRAWVQIFFPDNQIAERRAHIVNNSITVFFKWLNETRTYTVNEKNIKYFGHKPLVQVWDNNPLTMEHKKVMETQLTKEEIKTVDTIFKKLETQLDIVPPPVTIMKETLEEQKKKIGYKDDKDKSKDKDKIIMVEQENKSVAVLQASELFKLTYTNLTLGLWNKPQDKRGIINWMMILIVGGGLLLVVLHFAGVINIQEFLGMPTK